MLVYYIILCQPACTGSQAFALYMEVPYKGKFNKSNNFTSDS